MGSTPLDTLSELGQSIWLDELSRTLIRSGTLERMVREDRVVGVTSNPTIFETALATGEEYDDELRDAAAHGERPKETFWVLAAKDVGDACDLLRPVFDAGRRDGFASIEVDPNLAGDAPATLDEAMRLHQVIDRPNLLVKIPATRAGLVAIEEATARGRSINVTLIFGLDRYVEVAEAYLRGLERLVDDGGDPATVHSVASFFVSRVDTETDRRLDEIGGHDQLKGRLAIANAKLAYRRFGEIFAGERWDALAARGARPQRCLWASTSTKNPAYPDVMYVEALVGPDTINTMPSSTLRAFRDHGRARRTLDRDVDEALRTFDLLARAGVDYDDVTATLERDGVARFAQSFSSLLEGIRRRRALLAV